jgi:hypothetical protein
LPTCLSAIFCITDPWYRQCGSRLCIFFINLAVCTFSIRPCGSRHQNSVLLQLYIFNTRGGICSMVEQSLKIRKL